MLGGPHVACGAGWTLPRPALHSILKKQRKYIDAKVAHSMLVKLTRGEDEGGSGFRAQTETMSRDPFKFTIYRHAISLSFFLMTTSKILLLTISVVTRIGSKVR